MKAMIFAAGMGTRLKPITDTMPKALVPIGGRPLIEHVLTRISSVREHQTDVPAFEEAVVNVHHFADMIESWLDAWNAGCLETGRLHTEVSDERTELLETGGGILHARRMLEGCGKFLVHNVDILSDLDIPWFLSKVHDGSLATLLVSSRKTSRYLLFEPGTMKLVGWTNVSTGEVRSPYKDLNPSECLAYAFSGIHVVSDKVFDVMEEYRKKQGLPENPRFPIIDFYLSVCMDHEIHGVEAESLRMVDVGKLDTLEQAETLFATL